MRNRKCGTYIDALSDQKSFVSLRGGDKACVIRVETNWKAITRIPTMAVMLGRTIANSADVNDGDVPNNNGDNDCKDWGPAYGERRFGWWYVTWMQETLELLLSSP